LLPQKSALTLQNTFSDAASAAFMLANNIHFLNQASMIFTLTQNRFTEDYSLYYPLDTTLVLPQNLSSFFLILEDSTNLTKKFPCFADSFSADFLLLSYFLQKLSNTSLRFHKHNA